MSTERKLVPKLRFPEFRGDEGWEQKTLKEVCLQITNGKANAEDHEEDGEFPLFDRSAVIKKSSFFMFDAEAVIIPGEGMRFVPKYFQGKFNLHQRAYALMRHQGDGRFVYHSLDFLQDVMAKKAVKSTVLSLRLPIVENFILGYPSLPEQKKIADCLSTLDELIAAQSRKVDLLKTHKKGLMQQLFPREGETVPRLRFAEFEGEWEVVTFGDIFEFKPTNSLSRDQLTLESGSIRNIHYGDIHTKYQTLFKVESEVVPYIADIESVERVSTDSFLREGDLVFADASEDTVDIGKSIEIVSLKNEPVLAGMHTILARPTFNSFQSGFAGYLMKSLWVRNQIEREAQGTKVLGISPKRLAKIRFAKPKVVAEQRQIVELLASLDDQITEESQSLESLKIHKKGLMQGLFPTKNS
jgi:type I restriction enzyme S subunit